jgi:hypothetical protein
MQTTITLEGLNETQVLIADHLWLADSDEDIESIEQAFSAEQVEVVKQLMLAAAFDNVEEVSEANEVLQSFTL